MEFKVNQEEGRKLEAAHYEQDSMRILMDTWANSQKQPNPAVLSETLKDYRAATRDFNILYNRLVTEYVPEEYREQVEFNFAKCAFIEKPKPNCPTCK
jgi:hypothetical protein